MSKQQPQVELPLDDRLESFIARCMGGFKTKLIAGLVVLAPLWITFWALQTIFHWADGFSAPLVKRVVGLHVPGVGFALTFLLLLLCGVFATNVLGRRLLHAGRRLLGRLPVIRTIYGPLHQLMETITSPENANFKRVVLVEYPRQSMWALGFVAGSVPVKHDGAPALSLFIPTAPNPTSGFMLIVPPELTRPTSLSVEDAFQMIVSGGIVVPPALAL